ncbi:hypothetical protein [Streptomyces caatingaensis]|uniref:hypothetical protein n=1 Tax=Streptomyces caatingaensis TaxID=1678637 RepID=UPI000672792F|nr:hypothetical protein [Streptomyces caatingaensis]
MRDAWGPEDGRGPVTVWSRQVSAGWMVALGVVSAVGIVASALVFGHVVDVHLSLLLVPLALLALGAVRVSVTGSGVTVRSVLLPFLSRRIPMSRIRGASSRWSRPTELGGWGYRWLAGRTSVSLREGDALWLELASGRSFVITVDDAARAAELVNATVARRRPVG